MNINFMLNQLYSKKKMVCFIRIMCLLLVPVYTAQECSFIWMGEKYKIKIPGETVGDLAVAIQSQYGVNGRVSYGHYILKLDVALEQEVVYTLLQDHLTHFKDLLIKGIKETNHLKRIKRFFIIGEVIKIRFAPKGINCCTWDLGYGLSLSLVNKLTSDLVPNIGLIFTCDTDSFVIFSKEEKVKEVIYALVNLGIQIPEDLYVPYLD